MKKIIANVSVGITVVLLLAVLIFAKKHKSEITAGSLGTPYGKDNSTYYINEHILADFSDVIIERFREESELVVSSVDASISVDLKKLGIFNLDMDILNQTQRATYKGTGRFYIDMSMLGAHSIRLDNDKNTITIEIPHVKLDRIEIDPNRFELEKAQKGLLSFGDIRFTAKEYNDLQLECKQKMTDAIDTEEHRRKADECAVEEMKKIYEPIVKAVDDSFEVEIVFQK